MSPLLHPLYSFSLNFVNLSGRSDSTQEWNGREGGVNSFLLPPAHLLHPCLVSWAWPQPSLSLPPYTHHHLTQILYFSICPSSSSSSFIFCMLPTCQRQRRHLWALATWGGSLTHARRRESAWHASGTAGDTAGGPQPGARRGNTLKMLSCSSASEIFSFFSFLKFGSLSLKSQKQQIWSCLSSSFFCFLTWR